MQEIDFLPDQYRRRRVQRRSQPWQVIVLVLFGALVAAAAYGQHLRKWQVEKELATLGPQYDLALGRNEQLAKIQGELQTAEASAELRTYLRHPWPRTQLLGALLAPLPDEVTLQRLQITREAAAAHSGAQIDYRSHAALETPQQDDLAKLPPAARDLRRLREQFDKTRTVLRIAGVARESAALHRYLGQLGNSRFFADAELDSIENAADEKGDVLKFNATLIVRPGYGVPGGPAGSLVATPQPPRHAALTQEVRR